MPLRWDPSPVCRLFGQPLALQLGIPLHPRSASTICVGYVEAARICATKASGYNPRSVQTSCCSPEPTVSPPELVVARWKLPV